VKHSLNFSAAYDYSASPAISLPTKLFFGQRSVTFDAFVDTGSTFCIFKRGLGESLGLQVEAGKPIHVSTVMGGFEAFGHDLRLETLGHSCDVTVYFAGIESFSRNILGRIGWLNQLRVGIVEADSILYLDPYNQ
jgi:hypothetical protein